MRKKTDWKLTEPIDLSELDSCLPKKFSCRLLATDRQELEVLDDFHWHVWKAGKLLVREAETGMLKLFLDDEDYLQAEVSAEQRFWWELPKGELARQLQALLNLHAFVPKFQAHITTESLAVLNRDEKIVTRINCYQVCLEDRPAAHFVSVIPLRGYQDDYAATLEALTKNSSVEIAALDLRAMLLASGLQMDAPADKADFQLNPLEPAESAVCKMAAKMLLAARRYEQGLIEDIDTEFLHQYRVNIRKCRSLVSLFKKTLSAERLQYLKRELKILGSRTNDLRDLDVFLLDEEYYRGMLPDELQPGLKQIFTRVKRRRAAALKKVVAALGSEKYQAEVAEILETLHAEPERSSKQAQQPIKQLVSKKVLAQYQQICVHGRAIEASTPDEAVHELRIECKKLRYLSELFSEFFAKKRVKELVKHLKGLQDNLGRFNDHSVQRDFLLGFGNGRAISAEQLASINGLAAVLYNKQLHERGQVEENIAKFTADEVVQKFQELFAKSAREELS